MSEKRMLTVEINDEYHEFMTGHLDHLIDSLNKLRNQYSNQYNNLRFELSNEFYILYGDRLETDSEFSERLEAERIIQEQREKTKKRKLHKKLEEKERKERKLNEIKRIFNIDENVDREELINKLSGALALLEEH